MEVTMGRRNYVAVPPLFLGGAHTVKETICINEWTLALSLFIAFCLGWIVVRLVDRFAR